MAKAKNAPAEAVQPLPRGRPSDFTQEIADIICRMLSEGIGLREICRGDGMPSKSTVMRWLIEHKDFQDQYIRSREMLFEHWAEDIIEISDDATNDWMERHNSDGSTVLVLNNEHIQRSRLRVDSRKWLLSKLAAKKYGDKLDVNAEVSGKNGAPLVDLNDIATATATYLSLIKGA